MIASADAPAPGFRDWPHPSPVLDALGPFAGHGTDPLRCGFVVTGNKLNARGFLHAGVIATFADVAIGHALRAVSPAPDRYVTVGLTCELLGSATEGDWIDGTVTAHKAAGRVVSGSIVFERGDRAVATAHALFVPARERPAPPTSP